MLFDQSTNIASQYNDLRHFDEQVDGFSDHPQDISNILIKQGMHRDFTISLLHRHVSLKEGHVMLHSADDSTDICEMEPATGDMVPSSFYLSSSGLFQGFEYQRGSDQVIPSSEFFEELRAFLDKHQLQNIVAISRASPGDHQWLKALLPQERGMIAHRVALGQNDSWNFPGVETEWKIFEQDGIAKHQVVMKRQPPREGGGHCVSQDCQ